MAHLGIFCLPMISHINTFLVAARALRNRGHKITFFNIAENESRIVQADMNFERREPEHLPPGSIGKIIREMSDATSLTAMRLQGRLDHLRYDDILLNGPKAAERAGLDAMIVDQAEACSGTVADVLQLPWVSLCSGLCLNSEPAIPPFFTPWAYGTNFGSMMRNRLGYAAAFVGSFTIRQLVNRHRKRYNLRLLGQLDDTFSPFAQICQQNAEFDFPRTALPPTFHYVGPMRRPANQEVPFPWERLNGRPLIYASLGTVVNQNRHLYEVIIQACAGLERVDAQLVLSLGGAETTISSDLPDSAIVVRYAPQCELLAKAHLTITHAGLNTTLESLRDGVPLVGIPIAFEQPAIAARIRWTRCGEFVTPPSINPTHLRKLIKTVLLDPAYRQSVQRMKTAIANTRGAEHAADIIEKVLETGRPVLAGRDAEQSSTSGTP